MTFWRLPAKTGDDGERRASQGSRSPTSAAQLL